MPTHAFTDLDPATTYLAEVRAVNSSGSSAWVAVEFDTLVQPGPIIDVGLATTHYFTGLEPLSGYVAEVRAKNTGGTSAWVPASFTTPAAPRVPGSLYSVLVTLGGREWYVTNDTAPAYGPADPLTIEWSLPTSGLARPAQPEPMVAQLNLILTAADPAIGIGDLTTIQVWFGPRDVESRRPDVGFVGRVADGQAAPHSSGMLYQLTCAALEVDLAGYSPGATPLPAQPAQDRLAALLHRSAVYSLEVDPLLVWDPALMVDYLEPAADNLLALATGLLDQTTFAYADRLYRGILAARPGPAFYVDSISDEYVATAEAPLPATFGPLGSPTPYGILAVDPDDRAAGVIDACLVDFEASWSTLIPDVASRAVVTWTSVAVPAAAVDKATERTPQSLTVVEWDPPAPKTANRETTMVATVDAGAAAAAAANATRLGQLATLPPQTETGWSPESFRWLLYRDPIGLAEFPLVFPAPFIDPTTEGTRSLRTAAYTRPLVVAGIPNLWNPVDTSGFAAGQASEMTLTIEDGRPVVEFTLSPTLPVPGNPETSVPLWDAQPGTWDAQAGTWDDLFGGYVIFRWDDPALAPATWDTLEPNQTWYLYRLARGTA